ncbi:MAG: flagellar biosynthetic protein FliQ [Verrucomicrobiota bacterium]
MNSDMAYELIKVCLIQGVIITAPFVITAMSVGIVISILQTVTSIQEQTLTFVPKLLAAGFVLWFMAPWLLEQMGGLIVFLFKRAGEIM